MTELGDARAQAGGTASPPLRPDGEEPVRVLVVDDEDALRSTLARVLRQRGMAVETAENGFAALDLLDRQPFDVVLVDVRMPGMTGPQFLTRVKAGSYAVEVVMMTAFADITTTVSAVKAGAYAFLTKPFVSNEAVVLEVVNATQFKRLRERNADLQRELSKRSPHGGMIGSCPEMREVFRIIDGVATATSTVLVTGESGTGKELVARAIHDRSQRAKKPLVAVNCAAIPKELVESELFGHTRGAFTSAVAARAGLFEAANGGTIFLDEIGDLPTSAQVKLLRTLQSGEVKPVGSDASKIVDVRVIAATNADLKSAIAAGTFRQDLFYRLNVIRLELPPLRERGDDVLILAHHFIQKHAQKVGRPAPRLDDAAALCLQRYPWPGNVRELEHAIEHAVVLNASDTLGVSALPAEVREGGKQRARAPAPSGDQEGDGGTPSLPQELSELCYTEAKKRALTQFNESYIRALMTRTGGNLSEAARRSGLDRSNFRRLVRATMGSPDSARSGRPPEDE